jgi:hypothetical protein
MEQQTKSVQDLTQDDLYDMIKHYLAKVGAIPHAIVQWDHNIERIFKEHCHFGLGISHPILVPHKLEAFHPKLFDAMFGSAQGEVTTSAAAENVVSSTSSTTGVQTQESAPAEPQFKQHDNGDLSFALKTGVNQVVPPTTEEQLAVQVTDNTAKVANDLSTGDVVTKEVLESDKSADSQSEAEATDEENAKIAATNAAPDPTTAPVPPAVTPSVTPAPTPAPATDEPNIEGA